MGNLQNESPSTPYRRPAVAASVVYVVFAMTSVVLASGEVKAQSPGVQSIAPLSAAASRSTLPPSAQRTAIEQVLRHIYAVYLGIRSCTEISTMQNDNSFRPEVSLDESRQVLRQVDAAAREVGIDSALIWDAEAPIALITAEALKTRPETHLVYCHKMGSLFRVDAGNLQAGLVQAGARTPIITKDY